MERIIEQLDIIMIHFILILFIYQKKNYDSLEDLSQWVMIVFKFNWQTHERELDLEETEKPN